MQPIKTIGLDIAKSAFQVHGVDAEGKVLPALETPVCAVILLEAAALAGRHRSMRHVPLLVS